MRVAVHIAEALNTKAEASDAHACSSIPPLHSRRPRQTLCDSALVHFAGAAKKCEWLCI